MPPRPPGWRAGSISRPATSRVRTRQYRYALERARDASVRDLARLRLAAILLDSKDYAGALALLNETHAAAYKALYANLKGDVLIEQGKLQEARAAYQEALKAMDANSALKPLVEIKLDALGE